MVNNYRIRDYGEEKREGLLTIKMDWINLKWLVDLVVGESSNKGPGIYAKLSEPAFIGFED